MNRNIIQAVLVILTITIAACGTKSATYETKNTDQDDSVQKSPAKKEWSFQDSVFIYTINRDMDHCESDFQYFANTGNKAYIWQVLGDTNITRVLIEHCNRKLLTKKGLTSEMRIHYDIFNKKVWWCAYLKGSGEEIFSIGENDENQKDSLLKKVNLEDFEKRFNKVK